MSEFFIALAIIVVPLAVVGLFMIGYIISEDNFVLEIVISSISSMSNS